MWIFTIFAVVLIIDCAWNYNGSGVYVTRIYIMSLFLFGICLLLLSFEFFLQIENNLWWLVQRLIKVYDKVASFAVHQVVDKRLVDFAAMCLQVVIVSDFEVSIGHTVLRIFLRIQIILDGARARRLLHKLVLLRGLSCFRIILLPVIFFSVRGRRLLGVGIFCSANLVKVGFTFRLFIFFIVDGHLSLDGKFLLLIVFLRWRSVGRNLFGLICILFLILLIKPLQKLFERIHQIFLELKLIMVHFFLACAGNIP